MNTLKINLNPNKNKQIIKNRFFINNIQGDVANGYSTATIKKMNLKALSTVFKIMKTNLKKIKLKIVNIPLLPKRKNK